MVAISRVTDAAFVGRFKDEMSGGAEAAARAMRNLGGATDETDAKVSRIGKTVEQLSRQYLENEKSAAKVSEIHRRTGRDLDDLEARFRRREIDERQYEQLRLAIEAKREADSQKAVQRIQREAEAMRMLNASTADWQRMSPAVATARSMQTAETAQIDINRVLGVSGAGAGSAAASAKVFQAQIQEQEQLAAAAQRVRDQINPLNAAWREHNAAITHANMLLTRKAITDSEHAAEINRVKNALDSQIKAHYSNDNALQGGTGRFRQFGSAVQQAGYQIGDFAVQVASGQGVLRPFIQQGTQLISMFGPWGAAIGAAGAVIGAFAVSLGALGDSAEENARKAERFRDAIEDLGMATANEERREALGREKRLEAIKKASAEELAERDKQYLAIKKVADLANNPIAAAYSGIGATDYQGNVYDPVRDAGIARRRAEEAQDAFNLAEVKRGIDNELIAELDRREKKEKEILAVQGEQVKALSEQERTLLSISRSLENRTELRDRLAGSVSNQRGLIRATVQAEQYVRDNMLAATPEEQQAYVSGARADFLAEQTRAAKDNAAAIMAQTAALQQVAAAYAESDAAGRAAEARMKAEAEWRSNASINVAEHTKLLRDQAAADQLVAARKNVNDMKLQADAAERLTVAARSGVEASQEVNRQLEVEAFNRNLVAAAGGVQTEQIKALTSAYDQESARRLKNQQEQAREAAFRQASDEAALSAAKAQVATVTDPTARRAAELGIERQQKLNELTRQYGSDVQQIQKLMDQHDLSQAHREQERFWTDIRGMASDYAGDIKNYLLDGLTGVGNKGKSIFADMWETAYAGAKRFVVKAALELAEAPMIVPIQDAPVTSLFGSTAP